MNSSELLAPEFVKLSATAKVFKDNPNISSADLASDAESISGEGIDIT